MKNLQNILLIFALFAGWSVQARGGSVQKSGITVKVLDMNTQEHLDRLVISEPEAVSVRFLQSIPYPTSGLFPMLVTVENKGVKTVTLSPESFTQKLGEISRVPVQADEKINLSLIGIFLGGGGAALGGGVALGNAYYNAVDSCADMAYDSGLQKQQAQNASKGAPTYKPYYLDPTHTYNKPVSYGLGAFAVFGLISGGLMYVFGKLIGTKRERLQDALSQKVLHEAVIISPKSKVERFILLSKADYDDLNSDIFGSKIKIELQDQTNVKPLVSFSVPLS